MKKAQAAGRVPPKKRVRFKYAAPAAQEVLLVGSFNQWDTAARPMKKNAKGVWSTTVTLPAAEYEYRFLVDGEWQNDPSCSEEKDNGLGSRNSVLRF